MISSGRYSKSEIVLVQFSMDTCDLKTVFTKEMSKKYFAEGITVVDNKVYQLTYKENEVLVYNLDKQKDGTHTEYKLSIDEIKGMPKTNKLMQGWGLASKPVNKQ